MPEMAAANSEDKGKFPVSLSRKEGGIWHRSFLPQSFRLCGSLVGRTRNVRDLGGIFNELIRIETGRRFQAE